MKKIYLVLLTAIIFCANSACKKSDEDGDKSGYLSTAIKYPNPVVSVVTGRGLYISPALSTDESTKPLECSIDAIRDTLGNVLTNLMNYKVDTYFWKGTPTGLETELSQIDAIRTKVNRPAIDMNPVNGQLLIYGEATNVAVFPKGTYIIDVKIKNRSGEQVFKNALRVNTTPAGPYSYQFAGVDGIDGLDVTFTKVQSAGNKLIIRTLRKDGTAIDPKTLLGYDYGTAANPNLKDWHNLGLQKTTKYTEFPDRLEIEVAGMPIPVIGGLPAGQGIPSWGQRIDMYNNSSAIGKYFNYWFDFAIFEPGTWEIVVKLKYQ
ncbi:DUF5007 domain-containing protein [Pedobacter psychrodurus]|uniref:DUF5007 domain-containing protein n=1 Tax=Pedobacter psychrodurus TaxID=2530456 RepID=UPI00292D9282|nr:DUF5007 domain-containing protein [Pedobacter psychrodurus]